MAAVGEGLTAGIIFTIPALFLMGYRPPVFHIFLLSLLGGVLGILFMIPMRRYIIVKEHGILPFPEGTACAEILKAGEKSQPNALLAVYGVLTGVLYKTCNSAFYWWNETITLVVNKAQGFVFALDGTPSLLGVGYIVGPRISALILSGGALGWWVLIPLIKKFAVSTDPIFPGAVPVSRMTPTDIWSDYIRYIGAGTVAAGGIITLFRIAPVIRKIVLETVRESLHLIRMKRRDIERTDQDISLAYLLLGSIAIIIALWAFPGFHLNVVTIILLTVLGLFFVAVISITVGIVGSSSCPVSGSTITTLLITCLVLLGLGQTDRVHLIGAITMSAVANIAIALGSTTSQDLKTGFLLGATPRLQQIAEIIGIFLPAIVVGYILYLLDAAYKFGSPLLPAPQATLIKLIAEGVIQQQLPIVLVVVGIVLGVLLFLMNVSILPFAVGLYLPVSLSTGMMAGGIVSGILSLLSRGSRSAERGTLLASGLVAGDACMGVIIAILTVTGITASSKPAFLGDEFSLGFFVLLAILFGVVTYKKPRKRGRTPPVS